MTAEMIHGDARALPVPDNSVDCIVTSPPYNVGMEYAGVSDLLVGGEYEALADRSCAEMARVLKHSGRVWLNVAAQTNHEDGNGRRGNLTWLWSRALEDHGLWYRDTVVWHKPTGNNSTAWGSKLSPNAPNLRGRWEPILLHFKGEWTRGRVEQNDIEMGDHELGRHGIGVELSAAYVAKFEERGVQGVLA